MKCELMLSIDENDEIQIKLNNPGDVSVLTLIGALDLVKFGLQMSASNDIVGVNEEDSNADNTI